MKKKLLIILATSLVFSSFYTWRYHQARGYIRFKATVNCNVTRKGTAFQLFYDIGNGFRQKDSRTLFLDLEKETEEVNFLIPAHDVYQLRIDFLNGPGTVVLEEPRLSSDTSTTTSVSLNLLDADFNQATVSSHQQDRFTLTAPPGASDPFVHLSFPSPVHSTDYDLTRATPIFGAKIFVLLFCGISLIFFFSGGMFSPRKQKKALQHQEQNMVN